MYQVLFAEDELLVRLGLQNSISWGDFNMELSAQADNGITAYELYQKIRPDVVSFSKLFGGVFVSLFGGKFRF